MTLAPRTVTKLYFRFAMKQYDALVCGEFALMRRLDKMRLRALAAIGEEDGE